VDPLTVVVSLSGALLSGGGGAYILGALRRTAPAEVTERLNKSAMLQVDQLQERVTDAEATTVRTQARMREVEQEAEDTRQQMRAVRREAADLAERLASMVRMVHDPSMSLDRLRVLVSRSGVG
jgi:chromosome segregation ATPase